MRAEVSTQWVRDGVTGTGEDQAALPCASSHCRWGPAEPDSCCSAGLSLCIGFRNWSIPRLEACLSSIARSADRPDEVIVCDTGSGHNLRLGLRMLCKRYGARLLKFDEPEPWNRARALNLAIQQAHGPYIATTDADMIFPPGFFRAVRALLAPWHFVVSRCWKRKKDSRELEELPEIYLGGFQCAHKDWWWYVRGFDELYSVWGVEDTDLTRRAEQSGLVLKYVQELGSYKLIHQWHEEAEQDESKREQIKANRRRFAAVNHIVRNQVRWGQCETNIAISMVGGMRPETLELAIHALRNTNFGEGWRLYLWDNGPGYSRLSDLYRQLRQEGHVIEKVPEGENQGKCRAEIAERIVEPLLLFMDDDFEWLPGQTIWPWLMLLEFDPRAALVGGAVLSAGRLPEAYRPMRASVLGGELRYEYVDLKYDLMHHSVRYVGADHVANFWLGRTEKVRGHWDPETDTVGMHTDFMLSVRQAGQLVYWTPDVRCEHVSARPPGYDKWRYRLAPRRRFLEKWGISRIVYADGRVEDLRDGKLFDPNAFPELADKVDGEA